MRWTPFNARVAEPLAALALFRLPKRDDGLVIKNWRAWQVDKLEGSSDRRPFRTAINLMQCQRAKHDYRGRWPLTGPGLRLLRQESNCHSLARRARRQIRAGIAVSIKTAQLNR